MNPSAKIVIEVEIPLKSNSLTDTQLERLIAKVRKDTKNALEYYKITHKPILTRTSCHDVNIEDTDSYM